MKINFKTQYRKAGGNGKVTFVYEVNGTEAQLEAYKKAVLARQNGKVVIDDKSGKPLYFTQRFVGNTSALVEDGNGQFRADTTKFDQMASLTEQYGIEVATKIMGGEVRNPVKEEEVTEKKPAEPVAPPAGKGSKK